MVAVETRNLVSPSANLEYSSKSQGDWKSENLPLDNMDSHRDCTRPRYILPTFEPVRTSFFSLYFYCK